MNVFNKLNYIFSKKQKLRLIILLVLILIQTFMELLGVSIIMPFVNVAMDPNSISETWYLKMAYEFFKTKNVSDFLIILASILIVVYIVKSLYVIWMYHLQYKFVYDNQRDLSAQLMKCYIKQNYLFYVANNSSDIIRNVTRDTQMFFAAVLGCMQFVTEMLVSVVLFIFLFSIDFQITISVAVMMAVFILFMVLSFKPKLNKLGKESREYSSEMTKWVQQSFFGIKETKIYEKESYFLRKFETSNYGLNEATKKMSILQNLPKPIVEMICIVGMMVAVVIKLRFGTDASNFISSLAVFAVAAIRMLPSFNRMTAALSMIMFNKASVDALYNDLHKWNVENQEEVIQSEIVDFSEQIQFSNVKYRYPNSNQEVFNNISMSIPYNSAIAIVGASGSGKTTLVDILLGLLTPESGEILVDGVDIQKKLSGWRKIIGYIPQNIFLLDDTIKNNIAYGVDEEEIDSIKLNRAIKEAQLEQFVSELEDGVNTIVGERGARLSGGQRQRIGIARALYHEPKLLILDEATSALDTETEKAVMESVENLIGNKTIVIIAHRLSTIERCDFVYEVKDGVVKIV